MGHPAQGGASHATPGGKPAQSLFPFAQDAYPQKKDYYSALVKSLRKIGARDDGGNGKIPDTQSRARETGQKHAVISAKPKAGGVARARMTPQEVREMVRGNCSLIKTVQGKKMIEGVERRVKRLFENGNTTPETLARYLEDECGLEDWQAERIVKDQMLKYEAAARLEWLKRRGVKRVMWCAGKCEKHRPSHVARWPDGLNGLVFDIDNPPIDPATGMPTMPGEQINCHCYLKAVN